jgi:hypothetical protein
MDFDAKSVGWSLEDRQKRWGYAKDAAADERGWRRPVIFVVAYLIGPFR